MTAPVLSVVVPVLNEQGCIDECIERVSRVLQTRTASWEIIVVDDGSDDATVSRVERWMRTESRIQLLTQPHRGKGAAIQRGMLAAQGAWRLMADAGFACHLAHTEPIKPTLFNQSKARLQHFLAEIRRFSHNRKNVAHGLDTVKSRTIY